jgi:hypothetical protein
MSEVTSKSCALCRTVNHLEAHACVRCNVYSHCHANYWPAWLDAYHATGRDPHA